ncbi:homologous recombination OB-fold protein [Trifolium pratense]|uniref:homologous recombination OB-fold protein n=1 Tax=Trifolium pratense TaxID=57577 RepID=UPI001E697CD3|nr:homologous recombination OB-fold protein [Trifolium pratense]
MSHARRSIWKSCQVSIDGLGPKMELEQNVSLDDGDSDLSNFLRPCNHRTSNSPPLIPGPAGAVQAAMMQRRTLGSSNTLPTQEFVRRVLQNPHDTDLDFNSDPWVSAVQFLSSSQASITHLSSINKNLNGQGRVPGIVAVIKSCTPNGFGDMTVTLKDPTATIGASIHRKVFTKVEFGKDITVGSVLVLQKVAVFSPNGSTCYLNITLSNIVKVFSKDSGPSKHISAELTTPTSNAETPEKSWVQPSSAFSLPQERTEGILNNLILDSRFREVAGNGKQRDEALVLSSSHSVNVVGRNQITVLDRENLSPRQDGAGPVEATCSDELESEMEDQQNHLKLGEGDNLVGICQASSSTTNSAHISVSVDQETGMENCLERQKEIVNSKSSIPQWTDEQLGQLDELLAFD